MVLVSSAFKSLNNNLLLEHVGLPYILVLAVHLVNFFGWMSQGGHSEQLLFFALFYQSTPSCLKVKSGVGWVAHVILVSAQVLLVLTLVLWTLGLWSAKSANSKTVSE